MSKTLIVYYSKKGENYVSGAIKNLSVGHTEVAAKMIQDLTGGDLFFIDPVAPYTDNYNRCIEEAKKDLKANARPAFKNPLKDIGAYDTIYLGYPNYWGTMPMHLFTFLEMYNFENKVIKPFCTHEGSGMGSSERDIKKLCPKAQVESGLAIQGGSVNQAQSAIEKWVK